MTYTEVDVSHLMFSSCSARCTKSTENKKSSHHQASITTSSKSVTWFCCQHDVSTKMWMVEFVVVVERFGIEKQRFKRVK
mmetsp:Transcript_18723/g.43484  ORF Transcript_18723/g.43484 Transcript_18723/m.43484 type:complete len:80 (-) Transcript_18723:4-243(-)